LDLNDEATRFKKRNISATIVANVRRFCHRINTDEVFGTHRTLAELLDHLVGGHEQFVRHDEAELPGGLRVDDQLELGRLHQWQGRLKRGQH